MNRVHLLDVLLRIVGKLSGWLKVKHKSLRRKRELTEYLNNVDSEKFAAVIRDRNYVSLINEVYKSKYKGNSDPNWSFLYTAIGGIYSMDYIPHDLYVSRIESQLNNMSMAAAYDDKNAYDIIFRDLNRPKTYLRIIRNKIFDENYTEVDIDEALEILCSTQGKKIIKTALLDSGAGKGISVFSNSEAPSILNEKLNIKSKSKAFIIQEFINQHPDLSKFHASSVNLLKLLTCRVNGEINVISSLIRFGAGGRSVDSKGYFAGLDLKGKIKLPVFDSDLNIAINHKDSKVSFEGSSVPSYKEACTFCINAHKRLYHFELVSWDIAISKNGEPILIEINIKSQGIDKYQICNGPLFGKYTDDVLNNLKL